MHRDRTVARILLILSVVHLAVATPAIVRQRSLDVDDDVTPASEKRANPEDMPQGSSSVPQMDNESPTTSGAPHLDNGPPPALGTPHLDNDPQSASGAQNLHNDVPPALGTSQPHDDPLTASGTSPVEAPPPRPSPETSQVLSDAKNHKVKFLAGVGIATVFATIAFEFYAVHKYFKDQSQPAGRDLTSSDVVGRSMSTHPRVPKKPVSRALVNLRDEDLGLLSVLTRRVLERLD